MMHAVEIYEVERRATGHFFSPDTMRFFQSRTSNLAYPLEDGYLFWTSERFRDEPRAYTVRFMKGDGSITKIGEFQEHKTAIRAVSKIKTILAKGLPDQFRTKEII